MKKNLYLLGVSILLVACSGRANVREIQTRHVTPVNTTVKQAIFQAGAKKGWIINEVKPGEIEGLLAVRSHEVRVRIPYTDNSYAIYYEGSSNMSYNAKKKIIHRKYNQWVLNLDLAIRRALNVVSDDYVK